MKINFVLPFLNRKTFSGGALCLLNYASGLASLGHTVNIVTVYESEPPEWFKQPWKFNFISPQKGALLLRSGRGAVRFFSGIPSALLRRTSILSHENKGYIREFAGGVATFLAQRGSYGISKGVAVENLQMILPAADFTIATDFETAYAVALVGTGIRCYFSQHYEPFFWKERMAGEVSRREAELSYQLGLKQIVNSPWLAKELKKRHGINSARVCSNAIDHVNFHGDIRRRKSSDVLNIISYGGRDAEWKGFREMCEGVRLARERLFNVKINWNVYGSALLPPNNAIATYTSLGFLNQEKLVEAYKKNDVLLSASWYESFPLFPIEAMASGLATICTQPGTEVYAFDGETAEIVRPNSPDDIAKSLIKFATDEEYRYGIAMRGQKKAKEFSWEKSVNLMDEILLGLKSENENSYYHH